MNKSAKSVRISGGFPDAEDEEDLGWIFPSPSQETVGIHLVPKSAKVVNSMERLYAVPSEKMRVWSVWLTKIEEKAIEWHRWICTHLNLILRMSRYLQKAEKAIKQEGAMGATSSHDEKQEHKDGEMRAEEASMPADFGEIFDDSSEEIRTPKDRESGQSQRGTTARKETFVAETEEAKAKRKLTRSVVSERKSIRSGSEQEKAEKKLESEQGKEANDDSENKSKENNGEGGEILRDDSEATEEDETEELEKIAWPIGVPWEPVVQVAMEETKVSKKKEEKVKPIPIPENEEDMEEFIKSVKEQATVFRSLYKHWREVGDQAVNAVVNRKVMDSEIVPTAEDIPYFFYVDAEPDIEIGVEHDDEKILLPDLTREKIVSDFTPLYFNLADKPGKG
ncbi:uncharacterized protein [Venturia canescens]|uniref:uncharacterized protein n=1 Tax=Venturia canescens TaxID=32260 RepID=UPI001C9CC339|nr:uncharacterized protein LOC122408111 [Venturia canescens]